MSVAPLRPESKSTTTLPSELDGVAVLRHALSHAFKGKIAVVSSFGSESAVLLSMVASIDKATPVLFIQTGQHFPETLEYRSRLVDRLGHLAVRPGPGRRQR